MKRKMLALIAVLASLGSGLQATVEPSVSDDVAVLRAVLGPLCQSEDSRYDVISYQTLAIEDFERRALANRTVEVQNLLERNAHPSKLPTIPECAGLRLAAEAEIVAALKAHGPPMDPPQPGWEGFYARYQGARGVRRVTLPGYTSEGTQAVVMMSAACGSLCGFGFLYHLEKPNGEWKILRRDTLWQA